MPLTTHNPAGVFPPYRSYSHAVEVATERIWAHLQTILTNAGMGLNCLVSMRFYLADPHYDEANVRMRVKYLGSHRPALTVVCCRLLEPQWKIEVEAVAAG